MEIAYLKIIVRSPPLSFPSFPPPQLNSLSLPCSLSPSLFLSPLPDAHALFLQIEAIILSPSFAYSISTLTATRLVADIKKDRKASSQPFSNRQAEKLFERFCGNDGEGWLVRSE